VCIFGFDEHNVRRIDRMDNDGHRGNW